MPKPSSLLDIVSGQMAARGARWTGSPLDELRANAAAQSAAGASPAAAGILSARVAAKKKRDAASGAPVDENKPLWDLLDQRVIWSRTPRGVDHDAGQFGVEALVPDVANRYRARLQATDSDADMAKRAGPRQLVGVDLSGLDPAQQDLIKRALNPKYFDELEDARKRAQAQVDADGGPNR